MAENDDYSTTLHAALAARADWLDRSELPKLKDELRGYHTGFASLYHLFLKKRLINEDPYKAEAKIGELEVPPATGFPEAEKLEQLTQRLANYDNQLDFLVNFYQFSAEFLNLDRIKRILGLVKYIEWAHLTPDSQSPMTKAVSEITAQLKAGADALTLSVANESQAQLSRAYAPIMGFLQALAEYQREAFKFDLREVTAGMSQAEASNIAQVKKKFASLKGGVPFYAELVDEVVREDYTKEGPELRAGVLKKLQIPDDKPKTVKAQVPLKSILMEGVQSLGSTGQTLSEVFTKLDENQTILQNRKQSLMEKLKRFMQQLFNKEPEPVIYTVEYTDAVKGIPVTEKVNFGSFRSDLERKVRTFTMMSSRGAASAKLDAMPEEQLLGFLERNIREVQGIHKTLTALDDFFKAEVDREDRDKIRGIKPELGVIKNAIVRANSRRHEYSAQKEEEEQLKRLGVSPGV